MKISISYIGGNPTCFQLAGQFDRKGYLDTLFMPYCSRKHRLLTKIHGRIEDRQIIDIMKVKTNLKTVFYRKLLSKTRKIRNAPKNRDRFRTGDMFDRWVAKKIVSGNSDLILVESHTALHTIKKAKELGIVTFLYRTNSHINIQYKIDSEEIERLGLSPWHDQKDIERGLEEYEEADYIIALSTFVKQGFIDEGINADRVLVVSPGIDVNHFRNITKNDNIFRIIYCGGINHRKGIVYLLEAVSSLKLRNMELWLIGNVEFGMEDILRRYNGNYKLMNFMPNYELYKYYSQGSVFVLPSLEDSFGRVIVEAMACGLPAIVTTNTAAGDVVRENVDGFIVPIRNVEALREKILYLYENQDICREMGDNAIRRVHEKFTLNAFADRMFSAFKTVLNK